MLVGESPLSAQVLHVISVSQEGIFIKPNKVMDCYGNCHFLREMCSMNMVQDVVEADIKYLFGSTH